MKFLKDPKTSKEVRNLAFAYFTPDEFPTHRMLQELMMLDPMGAERDQIMEIATLILPWCRDGNYGCLFDGTSNLSLTGKIAHFELGYIPESAKELKAAAGFLITNHARKHIMTLPRAIRKRNVYEEVARFLDIPGGQEIVQESYAQLRKFNCWNISIVQQYARFKQSRIRSAVFGNRRQFFIMRQNDRADLEDMGKDIALPEVTQHAIMNYPLPDHQTGQKYSPFTYLHTDSTRNLCGTVHNVASPEMLYCSSSSGEHFDKTRPRASPKSQHRRGHQHQTARAYHSSERRHHWPARRQHLVRGWHQARSQHLRGVHNPDPGHHLRRSFRSRSGHADRRGYRNDYRRLPQSDSDGIEQPAVHRRPRLHQPQPCRQRQQPGRNARLLVHPEREQDNRHRSPAQRRRHRNSTHQSPERSVCNPERPALHLRHHHRPAAKNPS